MNLDEIKARAEKATPGPWEVDYNEPFSSDIVGIFQEEQERYIVKLEEQDETDYPTTRDDADFIAHAREDIPALIAEVERLTAENADLKSIISPVKLAKIAMMQIEFKKLQEKQTPKEGKIVPVVWVPFYTCPKCGNNLGAPNAYCDRCGQALKWEE